MFGRIRKVRMVNNSNRQAMRKQILKPPYAHCPILISIIFDILNKHQFEFMSYSYSVPQQNGTIGTVKSAVLANGVSLLFLYLVNYTFQILATFVLDREEKDRNKIKQRLLETSRVLYLFIIATMFSIYPPFYYGPHCAVLSWITLFIAILLHIFCIVQKSCKERSVWAYLYFFYHLSIAVWIILALIVGYAWSNQQPAANDEN